MTLLQKKHVRNIIIIALLVKACYVVFTYAEYNFNRDNLSSNFKPIQNTFFNNDAGWYISIAKNWYPKIENEEQLGCCDSDCFKQSRYGFFPAFPGMIRVVNKITGISLIPLSIIISQILSILAFLTFYCFGSNYFKNYEKAYVSTIVLMLFPFHYFFSMVYTESLFLVAVLLSFYGIMKNRLLITAFAFSVVVVTRPNGILMGLPLLILIVEQHYQTFKSVLFSKSAFYNLLTKQLVWLPAVIIFLCFCWFQYHQTEHFFAFIKAQEGWCKEKMWPYKALFSSGEQYIQVNSIYTVAMLVVLLLTLFFKKWSLAFYVLVIINIVIPLYYGSVLALPRYISVLFPLFLFLGSLVYQLKYRWIVYLIIFCGQLYSYHYWVVAPNYLGY